MWWFISDEHLGHTKILRPDYCNRAVTLGTPSIEDHDEEIILRHNERVENNDTVVHGGDTCWAKNYEEAHRKYIRRLNGTHIFLRGSHDHWLPKSAKCRWRRMIDGYFVVVDHYAGRTWERAYHGAWQLYGHWHHAHSRDIGLQCNITVDVNDFYPLSFEDIQKKMEDRKKYMHSWKGQLDRWILRKLRIL